MSAGCRVVMNDERSKRTYLGEIETGTISTVVVVSVHVQDLLAIDREESREDTFGKTGSLSVS